MGDTLVADDGTVLSVDPSTGDVTSATDNAGNSIPVPPASGGSSITQQFSNLVTYGVQALINSALPPAQAPKPGVNQPTPVQQAGASVTAALASPGVKMLLLIGAAFLLYKKLA